MSISFRLFQLQKIDTEIDKINLRQNEIRLSLSDSSALLNLQNEEQTARENILKAKMKLTEIENEVAAKRLKIERSEASLYSGKLQNPKELQDLQIEISSLKRSLADLEDRQLNAMLTVENVENALEKIQQALKVFQSEQATKFAQLKGELNELERNQERLIKERNAIAEQIDPEYLATYEKLRKQKRGIAVAEVKDESCSVCGAGLTPAEWQAARSPQSITYCSTCGRILYSS